MIHVVHVLYELMPSGAETMLEVAAPHWSRHGVTCSILATGPTIGPFADRLRAAGYPVHHLPMGKGPGSFLALRSWLKTHRVDCMHLHKEGAAVYHVLAAKGAVKRIVCTHHNSFPFNGFLRFRRICTRHIGAWMGARYIAIGQCVYENEARRFWNRTEVIHNWYDHNRFSVPSDRDRQESRSRLGLPDDVTVLLSVGNCNAVKNHPALIQALAKLRPERLIYLHVGREESGFPERALAEKLGIAHAIRFMGARADVPDLIAACDGFIMPSLYEGLSISALEALVSGVPCLLSDVPGLREFKGYPQIQWSGPSPDDLAQTLRSWIPTVNQHLRLTCIQQAPVVAAAYGVQVGVQKYAATYQGEPIPEGLS